MYFFFKMYQFADSLRSTILLEGKGIWPHDTESVYVYSVMKVVGHSPRHSPTSLTPVPKPPPDPAY